MATQRLKNGKSFRMASGAGARWGGADVGCIIASLITLGWSRPMGKK